MTTCSYGHRRDRLGIGRSSSLEGYSKELRATWALTSNLATKNKVAACKLGLSLVGFSCAGPQRVTYEDESLVGITRLIVKKVKSVSSPTYHS